MKTPFETLGIEPTFDLDMVMLDERHRALSAAVHPDRYADKPAGERRIALERAIEVNSAWRTLRDSVKRAEALLTERGVDVGELAEPKASPTLLMEMMEVRETLADARRARDAEQLAKLSADMRVREQSVLKEISRRFGQAEASDAVLPKLGELRYLRRFFEELDAIEDEMLG